MAESISDWAGLVELHARLSKAGPFLYRGQSSTLPLSTSFERYADRYGIPHSDRATREKHVIREFQRHYHRFASNVPNPDDLDRWLSLMQHHGAPTRALDFTYSFWVAVFFAIERLEPGASGTLWWFSWHLANEVADGEVPDLVRELRRDPEIGETPRLVSRILEEDRELLLTFSPHSLDDRFAIQQGAHLIPLTLRKPLAQIASDSLSADILDHVELCLDRDRLVEALAQLQGMNIERRVLFPGLDGLAEGLKHRMALDHVFPPSSQADS